MTPTPVDRLLEALTNRQRRILLYLLQDRDPIDLESAERAIAAIERKASATGTSDALLERTHLSLHHNHLPRLQQLGLVEYDRRSGTLRLDVTSEEQATLLASVREVDDLTVCPTPGNCD